MYSTLIGDTSYIVLKRINGINLGSFIYLIAKHKLAESNLLHTTLLKILDDILISFIGMHSEEVIHRDLNMGNYMIDVEGVRVSEEDFDNLNFLN